MPIANRPMARFDSATPASVQRGYRNSRWRACCDYVRFIQDDVPQAGYMCVMKLGYTIIYVADVLATIDFYERAFGLKRGFVHESNLHAELDTWRYRALQPVP